MSKLQALIREHLKASGLSAKSLSERVDISYPTVLAIVNEGRILTAGAPFGEKTGSE